MTNTAKTMRFQAGSFIELDDFHGGRRVAMVCRDGITCVDSMNTAESTPLFLHPVMEILPLGTLMEFVVRHDLRNAMAQVVDDAVLNDEPIPDALMLIQRLWFLNRFGIKGDMTISPEVLKQAKDSANTQRENALLIHHYAAHYVQSATH